jgi:hypothetical protein
MEGPQGALKPALVPVPLMSADDVPPARVVITPPGKVMARMRLLSWSATIRVFIEFKNVIPLGLFSFAIVPVPSPNPAVPLPTKVDFTPPFSVT